MTKTESAMNAESSPQPKSSRVLFLITNRTHLARQQLLLQVLGPHLTVEEVRLETRGDEEDDYSMDTRAGHAFLEACRLIRLHDPDIVLIRGDRFETLQIAAAATYLGKVIAHIEGGDVSGAVDEHIRHAVTKLSHLHFPFSESAKQRIIQMGEPAERVFNFGSLDCEFALSVRREKIIFPEEPYILLLHHETKEEKGSYQVIERVLEQFKTKIVKVKSNNDYVVGTGEHEFSPAGFVNLLAEAEAAVGNSSSFIKEAGVLGTPVVLVGERQKGRLRTRNVLDAPVNEEKITEAVRHQLGHGRYLPDYTYYQPDTANKIANVLLTIRAPFQK